jgi:lipopolysaccharide/colanic/teichoic acid biosynthesis glycosyltransferase
LASQDAEGQRLSLPASWAARWSRGASAHVDATPVHDYARIHGLSWQKRSLDIVLSIVALVLTSPLALVAAILIRATSRGPVFFTQERVGLNRRLDDRRGATNGGLRVNQRDIERRRVTKFGKPFVMYKFRTMTVTAEEGTPQFAQLNDPRVTTVGRFLRKTRFDEIPQFLNVLKGDMSIVGPRPERACFIERIDREVPQFHWRLRTKPGITGLAQVNVGYCNTVAGMRDKLQYDLEYIRQLGPKTDLKILARTVGVVVTGKGAF